jgi:hypothetical protein
VRLALHAGSDSDTSQYESFGQWLGKPVMQRVTFADDSSWNTIAAPYYLSTTRQWLASNPSRYETITVPLVPANGDTAMLADVAAGKYDSYWSTLAHNLTTTNAPQRIIVRLGWEENGTWYPWSAVSAPQTYKNAFRHVVLLMRPLAGGVQFEWNLSRTGAATFDWTTAYPGDDVVDIVSMDVYDEYLKDWNDILNGHQGLAFFRDFARTHHKPEAYAEWSDSTSSAGHGDDTVFIQNMHDWFVAGPYVLYQSYWNTSSGGPNAAIQGPGSGLVPKSAALYKSLFSQ